MKLINFYYLERFDDYKNNLTCFSFCQKSFNDIINRVKNLKFNKNNWNYKPSFENLNKYNCLTYKDNYFNISISIAEIDTKINQIIIFYNNNYKTRSFNTTVFPTNKSDIVIDLIENNKGDCSWKDFDGNLIDKPSAKEASEHNFCCNNGEYKYMSIFHQKILNYTSKLDVE